MKRSIRDLANSLKTDGKIVVSKSIGHSVTIVRSAGITTLVTVRTDTAGNKSTATCGL